ncbi:RNA polymerase sigma factor [Runella sp.]|uniref:RNA polymerase sigma factor n=1 Tax=Runella sp. TaxID=1960881 RepID=UPI003D0D9563
MKPRPKNEDTQQLWQDYRAGDSYALAQLMQVHYTDLFHWGMRLYPERELVKDCIQELFLSLWQIHATISEVENVRAYLLKALKTKLLRELSKKHNQFYELTDDYAFDVVFSADMRMIEDEFEVYRLKQLEKSLQQLPQRQQELIYLRFYQNLSYDQIAETMQIGRQSLYNLLQKALTSLRKHWQVGLNVLFLILWGR